MDKQNSQTRTTTECNWRPFAQAREFAQSLRLKNVQQWKTWAKTAARPSDIPVCPDCAHKNEWKGWGDWLGTGNFHKGDWRPFAEAREYARSLNLKNQIEWNAWAKTAARPSDIPGHANVAYKHEWKGWGDWLGTGNFHKGDWRPFAQAREFARSLRLKNVQEWKTWAKTAARPSDIPGHANVAYKHEWKGWGDWLGTGNFHKGDWRPFAQAREFARSLRLKNVQEWKTWAKTAARPSDIPGHANVAYKHEWKGWGDWLGTGNSKSLKSAFFTNAAKLIDAAQKGLLSNAEALLALKELQGRGGNSVRALVGRMMVHSRGGKNLADILRALSPQMLQVMLSKPKEAVFTTAGPTPDSSMTNEKFSMLDVIDQVGNLDPNAYAAMRAHRVNDLWECCLRGGQIQLDTQHNNAYQRDIMTHFEREQAAAENLQLPAGYSSFEPNMMQRRIAVMMSERPYLANWSAPGTGKTLGAILTSRVLDAKVTLILTVNSTIEGWKAEIKNAFPHVHVASSVEESFEVGRPVYLILNYEKFQQESSEQLVENLIRLKPDFLILDEAHSIKCDVAKRTLLITKLRKDVSCKVLALTATPCMNDLDEVSTLLTFITGATLQFEGQGYMRALDAHYKMIECGIRSKAQSWTTVKQIFLAEELSLTSATIANLLQAGNRCPDIEIALTNAKLDVLIRERAIKPGTVAIVEFTDEIIDKVKERIENELGLTVGLFYGDNRDEREHHKEQFIAGKLDVLIGSRAIGTGVDGLQKRSNRMVFLHTPWHHAGYEQVTGRINRQGTAFAEVDIVFPQVKVGEWSYDVMRHDRMMNKRFISDCVLDAVPFEEMGNQEDLNRVALEELKKVCAERLAA